MRFVYVLEDDPQSIREITDALLLVDPKIQVRQFSRLADFANWMKGLLSKGADTVRHGGQVPEGYQMEPLPDSEPAVLQMVISKIEFLGARQLGLMKRTREAFIRQQVCTREDPTAFVLTAFEDPNFKLEDLRDRILSNILIKPFDRLILQQHLNFALDGRHPVSKNAVNPYKTSAIIEALKTVELESFSQVGFVTRSNRPLPENAVSKYYAKLFTTERHRSLMGKMVLCEPHPEFPEEYRATFSFFAADPTQISNLRRQVLADKPQSAPTVISKRTAHPRAKVRIVVIEERPEILQSFESTLKRKIAGAEILKYSTLKEFLTELDPKIRLEDEEPVVKALVPPESFEVEMDTKGRILKAPEVVVQFQGIEMKRALDLKTLTRESDRVAWQAWLEKPLGSHLVMWTSKGVSFVMKVTHLQERQFRIEEGSAQDSEDFSNLHSRLSKGWDFALISERFAGPARLELWKSIRERAAQLNHDCGRHFFMVGSHHYTDSEELLLAGLFDDLFYLPIDRMYLVQKMVVLMPDLEILEDPVELVSIQHQEKIKSARPIQIEELSEASVILQYDRPISLGSFREFVLWQPYEVGAPEIEATCNFSEETTEKGVFRLHFVFFGVQDSILKAIRNWILENYIRSKDKG